MRFIRPTFRPSLIALVVIFGGWFPAGDASACEMSASGAACGPAKLCGCCEAPSSSTSESQVARPATLRTTTAAVIEVCGETGTSGCLCGLERPSAPEPKPGRTMSDDRTPQGRELGDSAAVVLPALVPTSAHFAATLPLAQRAPLYLRTSRLLI